MGLPSYNPKAMNIWYKLNADKSVEVLPPGTYPDFENEDRMLAKTYVSDGMNEDILVSTVFLGLDHSFYRSGGPPVLFESMVFGGGSERDQEQYRYCTYEEAMKGHQDLVDSFKPKMLEL